MSIDRYLAYRLGPGSAATMLLNYFGRSFTAPSLRAFWRYWNPGFGYLLLYYLYRPLRKRFPDSAAFIATFFISGLCHDALWIPAVLIQTGAMPAPLLTCWFLVIAVCVLLTDHGHVSLARLPATLRVPIHASFLAGTLCLTIYAINGLSTFAGTT